MFRKMLAKTPVEHLLMPPPGLPAAKFMQYAELFANEVMPAFRCRRPRRAVSRVGVE